MRFGASPGLARFRSIRLSFPGSSYRITAEASDNYRLASVEFTIDGQRKAELQAPPFELTYLVPASHVPGQRISVSALARDASGRVGVDSAEITGGGPRRSGRPGFRRSDRISSGSSRRSLPRMVPPARARLTAAGFSSRRFPRESPASLNPATHLANVTLRLIQEKAPGFWTPA